MSELIKNKGENESAGQAGKWDMSDVPAFDPDAAAKIYEAEHPEVVRDVEKARAMAMAGDRAESEAANYLEQADTALAAGAPTKAKD